MKQKDEDRTFQFTDSCVDDSKHRDDREAGKKIEM
jgi:hypothetical protein